jgi:hypothetical protein
VPTYEGEDPPIYQVYHDTVADAKVQLAEHCRRVAPRLSQFFDEAVLANT